MSTITLTKLRKALHGQYCEGEHKENRRRSVQGQTITQEKECFGTDNYTGEGHATRASLPPHLSCFMNLVNELLLV